MKITLRNNSSFLIKGFIWVLACLFTQKVSAQIVLDTAAVSNGVKIIAYPDDNQSFTDNGLGDGNYYDDAMRSDTIVICPESNLHQIKVTFNSFEVATGDKLEVYDCDLSKTTCGLKETAVGVGVSSAFGGWVQANCDHSINASGCLSFVLETNGDKAKGTGWEATVSCESEKVKLECPSDVTVTDDCDNLDAVVNVNIPKPTGTECDGGTAMVTLTSTCASLNALIGTTPVNADGSSLGNFNIPLGTHTITATSVSDPTIKCTYRIIVDQPTIVCNDILTIGAGFNCPTRIGVDDIVENPCVGTGVSYEISIDLGNKGGPVTATVDGTNFTTLSAGGVDFASLPFTCHQEFPVTVTRIVNVTGCGGAAETIRRTCSSKIRFDLTDQPTILVPSQTITSCEDGLTDEEIINQLDIQVSCGVFETEVTIESFPGNLCALDASAEIKVVATDVCGNKRSKRFDILVVRPSRFFKPADTSIVCETNFEPESTGYPILDADNDGVGDNPIIGETCDFIATYEDQLSTSNGRTITRTWTIHDRCNLTPPVTLSSQTIFISNSEPVIDCPENGAIGSAQNPYVSFTNGQDCQGRITLTTPSATAGCGVAGEVTVTLSKVVWAKDTSEVFTTLDKDFPVGDYYAEYRATDTTGLSSTCQIYFSIQAQGGLTALCESGLNAAYVGSEIRLLVADIDASDNTFSCTEVTKTIKKEGGDWGQEIFLNCEEVANQTKIYLRVTDEAGNENTCWTTITGKDIQPPTCLDLEDLSYTCDEFHQEDFGLPTDANNNGEFDEDEWEKLIGPLATIYSQEFGQPICDDNLATCFNPLILQQYQLVTGQCGGTKIKRRYQALDESGNLTEWQEQEISLVVEQDFSVTFPSDWTGNCGEDFPEPSLDITTKGCNILAWESSDKIFDGVNECTFIERTYSVTNWCLYQTGQTATELTRIADEHNFSEGHNGNRRRFSNSRSIHLHSNPQNN